MADAVQNLKADMATSAVGYAVVVDGVLNVNTVSESEVKAAQFELIGRGFLFIPCDKPDCRCIVCMMEKTIPGAKIVTVVVAVIANG